MIRAYLMFVGSVALALGADADAGKAVYGRSCQACHGPSGQGNPGMAKVLNVVIPPLISPEVQSRSDAEIKKVLSDGKGKMKAVKLSDGEAASVVSYLRSLAKNK